MYHLHERFKISVWLRFVLFFMAFFFPAFWGMKKTGHTRLTFSWLGFMALFLGSGFPPFYVGTALTMRGGDATLSALLLSEFRN
jgi:hypothetical protein